MKYLKKCLIIFILFFILFIISLDKTSAKEVNVYMFYGKTCPHCEEALNYLESIKEKYNLNILKYEVWENEENKRIMKTVADAIDINVSGVPFCVIDNTGIVGYSNGVTDDIYKYHILKAAKNDFIDNVGIKLGIVEEIDDSDNKEESFKTEFFLLDKVNLKNIPLFLSSMILGLLDGFNICSIWLLFLIVSILLTIKDKKRIWILIITFLLSSMLIYLAFMLSLLSFDKMINVVTLVKVLIALLALVCGAIRINSYLKLLDNSQRKVNIKTKWLNKESIFILLFFLMIFLGFSFNIIELACNANNPDFFMNLLKISDLNVFKYGIYTIIYILFFMLDNIILFIILIKIIELSGLFTKRNKYLCLISGVFMFLVGVLLILKPEWLMFNF